MKDELSRLSKKSLPISYYIIAVFAISTTLVLLLSLGPVVF